MPRKRKSASSPTQTNLLDVAAKLDPAYDSAGNMETDGSYSYAYNAESEIKSAAGVNYTYDGDGNRLEKSNGKIYWYGSGTEILDESDLSGNITAEYVFFAGKRIAMRNVSSGNIYYYEEDMLGSSRTMVQAGQTSPCYDADFLPFGYEKDVTSTCTTAYKFEGKERDTETNNDYFGARYYSNHFGRWLSPDWAAAPTPIPYANMTNPQTLNLYAMVSDNPESFADLDGHSGYTPNGSAGWVDISSSGGDICPAMDAQMSATAFMHPQNKAKTVCDASGLHCHTTVEVHAQSTACGPNSLCEVVLERLRYSLVFTKTFATNFGSLHFYKQEISSGGCWNVAGRATVGALNPFSSTPSMSSDAAAGAMTAGAINRWNAAQGYAASRTNVLDGEGLIFPQKSIPYNKILDGSRAATLTEGLLGYLDGALFQGVMTEAEASSEGVCQ